MAEVKKRLGKRVQTKIEGETRTVQSERELVDVNAIVGRYRKTGLVTHLANRAPMYGDFSESRSLQASLDQVHAATDAFMELPSSVRQAASNSPVTLLEMLATEEGTEALIAAGLDAEIVREGDEVASPQNQPEAEPASSEPEPSADPQA